MKRVNLRSQVYFENPNLIYQNSVPLIRHGNICSQISLLLGRLSVRLILAW